MKLVRLLPLIVCILCIPYGSAASATARDWTDLQLGDVVAQGSHDVSTGACVATEDSSTMTISFTPEESAKLAAAREATGQRVRLVKAIELTPAPDNPCEFKVSAKVENILVCPEGASQPQNGSPPIERAVQEPEEVACSALDPLTLLGAGGTVSTASVTQSITAEYKIRACCYDWWLTDQTTQMSYTYTGSTATYNSGSYACTGNWHHDFWATQCDYQDWVPGPAGQVGYTTKGHYVQVGSAYNFLKYTGVQAQGSGNSWCSYSITGVYPYDTSSDRHVRSCWLG